MTVIRLMASSYWFIVMPLLLGMTWNKIKKETSPSLMATFTEGYLLWFALFYVGSFIEYRRYCGFTYWKMTRVWMVGLAFVTVVCLIVLNKTLVERIRERVRCLKRIKAEKSVQKRFGYFIGALILTIFSLAFVRPSLEDNLIERGNSLIKYDTIRVPNELDLAAMAKKEIPLGNEAELIGKVDMTGFSYPEMFYTIPAGIFGVKLSMLVHMVAAFGLLLFFFCTYRTISRFLYKEENKQNIFCAVVVLFYMCMTIADVHLSVGVFQNIWNPITLVISCLVPITLCEAVELGKIKRTGMFRDKWKSLRLMLMILCTLLAAQLFMDFGAGSCGILLILGLLLV